MACACSHVPVVLKERGIVMVRAEIIEEVKNLAGGKGTCFLKHVVTEEELFGHGRMYAKVVVPPGCSVGWHQHVTDTEPYYILKGEGVFIQILNRRLWHTPLF